jgi:Ca-activated chloride channel family protein
MKRNLSLLTVVFIGLAAVSGWFAQTNVNAQMAADRDRKALPTPTATPPVITTSPTPKRTPAIDDPTEIIKIDTELVNLNVRVVDRNNRPINGLTQNDFKILEDGTPQQIDFFSQSEVTTNYGIVVDNSGSMRQQLDKVIEAGKVLVNTNRADDDTMIIRFVGRDKIEIEQEFTSNKQDLLDAMDNMFIEGGQTAVIDAVYLAVEKVSEHDKSNKLEDRKRRAIILVTDGEDRNSYYSEKQLFDLLQESEVQIYVVGFVDELSKDGGFISKSPQDKAKTLLEKMAKESGGKAYFPKNPAELPSVARDISSELRTQYSIGYIPSNDKHDGTYRNIKVVVNDGPGLQKRIPITRPGRTADSSGTSSQKTVPTPVKQ